MMIKVLGDTALLVEVQTTPPADALAKVQAATRAIRALALPEILEVVPAITTVGVYFAASSRWADVARKVRECLEAVTADELATACDGEREVELPVCYEGEYAPDLAAVAETVGLSPAEVVARHSGGHYRVQAVGFAPGFPYLSGLDPALACPRKATPRTRLEAGSVGIGGAQTGVYPQRSPGGWNLIGRTPRRLFDVNAAEPALLRAGDWVRFKPIDAATFVSLTELMTEESAAEPDASQIVGAAIEIEQPGVQTTVQDYGRRGYQDAGVTEGGAVDGRALRLANLMVGNPADAAALEWALRGPVLRFRDRRVCVVMGAIAARVPFGRPFVMEPGAVLDLSQVPVGFRGILAINGGVDAPVVLGSRSTNLQGGFGGWGGRALETGDVLPLGTATIRDVKSGWLVSPSLSKPVTGDIPEVRVLRGPEGDAFRLAAWNQLLSEPYRVGSSSDRMGMRLEGPELELREPLEMVSQPVQAGTVQVPPSGKPIVLLADRQSLGGYPRIATVISVDLPVLAQVPPGGRVQFVETTLAEAEALRLTEERDLGLFATAVEGRLLKS
ncbi:5-oxoprolinase subunit PxpB [Actomonas aquatica]|uniref:5-oxoprolinase subunit PxpB n=1 Tax=Actomonas aquatica TaxID=2866162 RepID=A0ABZ1CBM9_9BACT|nr:5-oxoprolinase subunit PxpB [Opitutus sp. WL0086]WRQ89083.1 5-oxoprolinase subunit PxpB [Opitutus sp. WL0086]